MGRVNRNGTLRYMRTSKNLIHLRSRSRAGGSESSKFHILINWDPWFFWYDHDQTEPVHRWSGLLLFANVLRYHFWCDVLRCVDTHSCIFAILQKGNNFCHRFCFASLEDEAHWSFDKKKWKSISIPEKKMFHLRVDHNFRKKGKP